MWTQTAPDFPQIGVGWGEVGCSRRKVSNSHEVSGFLQSHMAFSGFCLKEGVCGEFSLKGVESPILVLVGWRGKRPSTHQGTLTGRG